MRRRRWWGRLLLGYNSSGSTGDVAYCWGPNQNGVLGVGGFPSPIVMETTPTKVVGQP